MSVGEYDPLVGGGPGHDFDNPDRPKFELIPAGNHSAVCVLIWDCGTHLEFSQQDNKDILNRSIIIGWEISKKKEDGSPFVVLEQFRLFKNGGQTFSHPLSKLRKLMEDWRGAKFTEEQIKAGVPIRKILGQPCLVSVKHSEGKNKKGEPVTYAGFGGLSPLPEGMTELQPVNPPTIWLTNDYPILGNIPAIDWVPNWYGESLRDIAWDSNEVLFYRKEAGENSNATASVKTEQPAAPSAQSTPRKPPRF